MKVRGMKISEFEFGGAVFAVVKLSDDCDGGWVAPGSDQADAVLRLEGLAEILGCEPEELEKQCKLAVKIAEGAEELCDSLLDAEEDLLDPQVGDIFIVGTDGEINDFIRQFIGCDQ